MLFHGNRNHYHYHPNCKQPLSPWIRNALVSAYLQSAAQISGTSIHLEIAISITRCPRLEAEVAVGNRGDFIAAEIGAPYLQG